MAKWFSPFSILFSFIIFGVLTVLQTSAEAVDVRNIRNHRRLDEVNKTVEIIKKNFQDESQGEFLSELDDLENDLEGVFEEEEATHPCQRTCEEGKPMTCRYDFTIEYYSTMSKACFNCPYNITQCNLKHCIPGDGVKRTVLVINRQMPGPAIEVCKGDTVEVEVKNQMFDISTTIHWHGVLQKETPFMDGVPFVSQCMIPPQASFLYRFYADNSGTHLWHSHSALQRGDGMFGPLIVKIPKEQDPNKDLYDFDLSEHVISLLDWGHVLSVNKFVAHYHSTGDNKPPSILVNGKGRFKEFVSDNEVIFTPAEKFNVTKGFRYRFRIINAGFLNCPIEITVDNHNLTVIASDGGDLQPMETETLVTVAGERFDVVIDANQEVGNYWMRFRGLLDCSVKKAFQVAILHYEGADVDADPEGDVDYDTSVRSGLKLNAVNSPSGLEESRVMSELSSTPTEEDPALKPEADVKFYIPYDFYPVDNIHYHYPSYYGFHKALKNQRTYTPQINHISMQFPSFPLMANVERASDLNFCNATSVSMDCRYRFCECPHVLEVPLNAVVEIILIDEGVPYEANHPFHLHGYNFRVIGMDRLGESTTEQEVRGLDEEGLLKRNLINPPIKDTVGVPDGGYTIIRFHATNPGYWILHCHLDFHVELGMALLFKVGEHSTFKSPPDGFPMCNDSFRPTPVNSTVFARFFPYKTITEKGNNSKQSFGEKENLLSLSSSSSVALSCFFVLLLSVLLVNN